MTIATQKALTPVQRLKNIISADSVQEQLRNALKENSNLFVASLIDIYGSDAYLQKCDPSKVVAEAFKAATLKLPINKGLGFAYIVPYGDVPQFQIGYKGYIQLGMRTGQYKFLNAGPVYEGEYKGESKLTGEIDLTGDRKSDKMAGYFAYMELTNGFKKALYWSHDKVLKHAKKYSKSYGNSKSAWATNFDEMGVKTVIRSLLSHYGILSVDMMTALTSDQSETDAEQEANSAITMDANTETIDIAGEIVTESAEDTVPGPGF